MFNLLHNKKFPINRQIDINREIFYTFSMYIPYEKIGEIFYKLTWNAKSKEFFLNKKVLQNIAYINQNKPKVLSKLNRKLKNGEKLNIVFYVYDETKWKCQSLYNYLAKNPLFNTKILVTKTSCENKDNPSFISNETIEKTYNYFKKKNLNVDYAYNTKTSKFLPFKEFEPDIIFYQHPWYVKTEQGPVVCSKFALTGYIPYYFPIETADIDCNLRFHKYVENYYIPDNYTKEKYLNKNPELKEKLKVVGYPYLDYFDFDNGLKDEYIIYAPHWTVAKKGLAYSTFDWSGEFILKYAQSNPETKWIFKPHPLLKKALVDSRLMTQEQAQNYYSEWDKLGIRYESGDYLELFSKSKMMITDCSSFLGEYFVTGKPLIHLMSKESQFNNSNNPILKAYYRAYNLDELKDLLKTLPQNDYMKEKRLDTLKTCGLVLGQASKNICDDILGQINP